MRGTWVSLAATLALGAAAIVLFPFHSLTPGTLREGHRAQKNDCFSCQTLLAGAPAAKCSVCHRTADMGLRSVKGELLPNARPRSQLIHKVVGGECAACHTEHGGRLGPNATRRFTHELLPASLAGGCAACHSADRPTDSLHAAASAECTPCHATKGWKPATWDHDRSFRFDRHHPARCLDCHRPGTGMKVYSCTGCHEHSPDRLESKHREEGITNLDKCRRCHPSGSEHDTIREGGRGEGKGREGASHDEEGD